MKLFLIFFLAGCYAEEKIVTRRLFSHNYTYYQYRLDKPGVDWEVFSMTVKKVYSGWCKEGESFGYTATHVWVKSGCKADFYLTYRKPDVDECFEGTHNCHANAKCSNTDGAFECDCNDGYDGDGVRTCKEHACQYDPCARFGEHQICIDGPYGTYECLCTHGYNQDSYTGACNDVDECLEGTHNCNIHAGCTNNDGGFECDCNSGWSGDGVTCNDVDECFEGTHNCHPYARCTNFVGEFRCTCPNEFDGDGVTCIEKACLYDVCGAGVCTDLPMGDYSCDCNTIPHLEQTGSDKEPTCTCASGYKYKPEIQVPDTSSLYFVNGACSDVDECFEGTHNCNINARCTNNDGGFECDCNDQYLGDGVTCLYDDPTKCGHRNGPSGSINTPFGPVVQLSREVAGLKSLVAQHGTPRSQKQVPKRIDRIVTRMTADFCRRVNKYNCDPAQPLGKFPNQLDENDRNLNSCDVDATANHAPQAVRDIFRFLDNWTDTYNHHCGTQEGRPRKEFNTREKKQLKAVRRQAYIGMGCVTHKDTEGKKNN